MSNNKIINGNTLNAVNKVNPDWRIQLAIVILLSAIGIIALFVGNFTICMTVVCILAPPSIVTSVTTIVSFPSLINALRDGRVTIEEWMDIIPVLRNFLNQLDTGKSREVPQLTNQQKNS